MKNKFLIVISGLILLSSTFFPAIASADVGLPIPGFDSVSNILDKVGASQSALGAIQTVPTKDIGLEAKETSISIFGYSLGISWNQLAITIAKTVLNQIIGSTINWMNSGFNGSPAFVTDPKAYFGNLANGIAGDFIKNSKVGFLCSPIQSQINVNFKLGLQQAYEQPYRPQCTITGVGGNIQNFYDNFTNGGWGSFIQMTQNSANNPYGTFVDAQIQMSNQLAAAVGSEKSKIDWGQGFKSQGDCVQYNPQAVDDPKYNEAYQPGDCVKYGPDKTPGSTIKAHLDATLPANSIISQITTADQFDKILTALGNGFLRKFVFSGGGLLGGGSGSSGSTGGTSGPPPTVVCSASPSPAVMNVSKVTWSVDNNFQNKAVSFTWAGDDNLTGVGDSATHTYTQFGTMNAHVIASTTNLDDLGNYTTKNPDQSFPCTPLIVSQWPPLSLVSCTPSVVTTKTDAPVTWTATITGGSGVLQTILWSGGQSSYPGCSITNTPGTCSIWMPVPFPPTPLFDYPYTDGPGGKTVGHTIYTTAANPDKTTTLTATRVYFGNNSGNTHIGAQPGDSEQAQLKVFDAGANVLPLTADCGSISIVP